VLLGRHRDHRGTPGSTHCSADSDDLSASVHHGRHNDGYGYDDDNHNSHDGA